MGTSGASSGQLDIQPVPVNVTNRTDDEAIPVRVSTPVDFSVCLNSNGRKTLNGPLIVKWTSGPIILSLQRGPGDIQDVSLLPEDVANGIFIPDGSSINAPSDGLDVFITGLDYANATFLR